MNVAPSKYYSPTCEIAWFNTLPIAGQKLLGQKWISSIEGEEDVWIKIPTFDIQ